MAMAAGATPERPASMAPAPATARCRRRSAAAARRRRLPAAAPAPIRRRPPPDPPPPLRHRHLPPPPPDPPPPPPDPPPPPAPPPVLAALATPPVAPPPLGPPLRRHWLGLVGTRSSSSASRRKAPKGSAVSWGPPTGSHVVLAEGCAKRHASASYSEVQSLAVLQPLLERPLKNDFEQQRRWPWESW